MAIMKIEFLDAFMSLFNAHIAKINISAEKIFGTIAWKTENDQQDFCWSIPEVDIVWENLILLCNYIKSNHLIEGDKIIVSDDELLRRLIESNWNPQIAQRTIDELVKVEVKMIDENEETDSFFVHF